jgi:putative tricarboxylic transport membrane protein
MLKRDAKVGLFLITFISIPLCYGSVTLGIGTAINPGPGFIPFFAGLILFLMSIVMIFTSLRKRETTEQQENVILISRGAIIILIALILSGLLVERIGFFICTFCISILVLRINGINKWMLILLISFLNCIVIFIFFNLLLQVRLPLGILQVVR